MGKKEAQMYMRTANLPKEDADNVALRKAEQVHNLRLASAESTHSSNHYEGKLSDDDDEVDASSPKAHYTQNTENEVASRLDAVAWVQEELRVLNGSEGSGDSLM